MKAATINALQDLAVFETSLAGGDLKRADYKLQEMQSHEDIASLDPVQKLLSSHRDTVNSLRKTVADQDRLQADMQTAKIEADQAMQQSQRQTQAENDQAVRGKEQEDELTAKIKAGPPPGATIFHGIYIGEPARVPGKRCNSYMHEAIEDVLTKPLSETCWLLGEVYISKAAFFSKAPIGNVLSSLTEQFGRPLPGLHYMIDTETRPEWVVWSTKDHMLIAAKQDHVTGLNGRQLSFTETFFFGPCQSFRSVLSRCEP